MFPIFYPTRMERVRTSEEKNRGRKITLNYGIMK